MKDFLVVIFLLLIVPSIAQTTASSFQAYSARGDNLIHIVTADFDDVGVKDYVVAMTTDGKVIAFQRPDQISDPTGDNRLWEYTELPSMGIRIIAGDIIEDSQGDEVILPGTDGHLRVLSSSGELLMDQAISTGALYTAAVAKKSNGIGILATAGVDGSIYFIDSQGEQVAQVAPQTEKAHGVAGVIRHVVAGDFNGDGTDELMSFVNNRSFRGNCFFDITDLSTYERPDYWNGITSFNEDDVAAALGFTDKQLPHAYDMDGDGDEEVVGHWGVLHPEEGPRTQVLSTMLSDNEKLSLSQYENFARDYLIEHYGFSKSDKEKLTNTGKYLLQQGIPGDFDNDGGAEVFTLYGDDLFLSDYNAPSQALSISDYTWSHSMYHFSDGARLEDRNGGADQMVLVGPINGDDHFYTVDLSNSQWETDARDICCSGKFAEVEQNLDQLANGIDQFSGTVAGGHEPIWFVTYFASWLGWPMTEENINQHAQRIYDAQQSWYDKIGGEANYSSSRIRFAASMNSTVYGMSSQCKDPDITAQGMVDLCRALAQKGAYFCLKIGHGNNLYMSPENLADCYEASVVDGECYMMARTRELKKPQYFDLYQPHLDALLARATELDEEPPMVMLCAKGAVFSAMSQQQGDDYFPSYRDILVPGVENSNVTVPEWSLAERVGLWMNGDVRSWGSNVIGDNLAANRVAEWGGMRNAHVVLRQLLSEYALGARVFRITAVISRDNPMYVRGDVDGADKKWSQPFQKGVLSFLNLIEKGIYPHSPSRQQIKGISPVSVALYNASERLMDQSIKHDYFLYQPENTSYALNQLACWNAYTDVPEHDLTAFLYGTERRWDNLIPSTPGGFVTLVPHKQPQKVESNHWCNQAYQTNGDFWANYGVDEARNVIEQEVISQRDGLDFYVEGECFWQVTQQIDDPKTYFMLLMGNDVLSPEERTVTLKAGNTINGECRIFDQLNRSNEDALGVLSTPSDELELKIPAGIPRLLTIKLSALPSASNELEEKTDNNIVDIYPNPACDYLNLEVSGDMKQKIHVQVFDVMGRQTLNQIMDSKYGRGDVSNWDTGAYFVWVRYGNKTEVTKVLVNNQLN